MTVKYDGTDLLWSPEGDIIISATGDLDSTDRHALFLSTVQEIQTRIRSDVGDWATQPSIGASLSELVGKPSNQEVAEQGKTKIQAALTRGGFLPASSFKVRYIPISKSEIVYNILVKVPGATNEQIINLSATVNLTNADIGMIYDKGIAGAYSTNLTKIVTTARSYTPPEEDTTSPALLSAVSQNSTKVRLSFSEDMNDNVELHLTTNYSINGDTDLVVSTVTLVDPTTIDLTVNEMLQDGSYSILVTNISDSSGNIIDPNYNTASFTGIGIAPRILSVSAIDSETIRVIFNEDMGDSGIEISDNYIFDCPAGAEISTSSVARVSGYQDRVDISILGEMQTGTSNYTIIVADVVDTGGNVLDSSFDEMSFDGVGTLPRILEAIAYASPTNKITVTFNEEVDETSVETLGNWSFPTQPSGAPITKVSATKTAATIVDIIVTGEMLNGTDNYSVQANNIIDLVGNTIDPLYSSITFDGVGIQPQVSSAVATSISNIRVVFNENMSDGSETSALTQHENYAFTCPLGATITVSDVTKIDAQTVDITISGEMKTGTNNYTVTVSNVIDSVGNVIDPAHNSDTFNGIGVAPSVSSAAYVDSTHCTVTFNENMDTTTAQTTGNYVLSGPSSPSVSTAILAGNVVTLTLGTAMVNGLYTVTVSNITDVAGNTIDPNPGTPTFTAIVTIPVNIMLHGGIINTGGSSNKTWLWNGTTQTWTEKTTNTTVSNHASAYHVTSGKSIYYGGAPISLRRTYIWSGDTETWTYNAAEPQPSHILGYLQAAGACYDKNREKIVLFGGYDTGPGSAVDKTWEWNGSIWVEQSPVTKPPARWYHSMAFDEERNVVVLFGGMNGATRKQDTWEYNGTTWTEKASGAVTKPSVRSQMAMAYCPVLKKILLFGGTNDDVGTTRNCETWSWDGTNWVQLVTGGVEGIDKPSKRFGHAMACDNANNQIVLFSGQDGTNNRETWIWNGSTWTKLTISGTYPVSLRDHSMCGSKKP